MLVEFKTSMLSSIPLISELCVSVHTVDRISGFSWRRVSGAGMSLRLRHLRDAHLPCAEHGVRQRVFGVGRAGITVLQHRERAAVATVPRLLGSIGMHRAHSEPHHTDVR